ncbi:MAG: hypothetical protein ACRYGF_03655 [Janthinobacterium lividum]
MKVLSPLLRLLWVTVCLHSQAQVTGGTKSQNIGENYGTATNINIKIVRNRLRSLQKDAKLPVAWDQILEPGSEPNPKTFCDDVLDQVRKMGLSSDFPDIDLRNQLKIYYANGLFSCPRERCSLIVAHGVPLLTIEEKGGVAAVYAKLWGADGRIAAELDENRPYKNDQTVAFVKRPNTHTLKVIDQRGKELLSVQFLNKKAIYVEGIFYSDSSEKPRAPSDRPLIINKDGVTFPKGTMGSHTCFLNNTMIGPSVNQQGAFGDVPITF